MTLSPPTIGDVVAAMSRQEVKYLGQTRPVGEWVAQDQEAVRERRTHNDVRTFQRFLAALLETNVSGASYHRRLAVFAHHLGDPETLTRASAEALLREAQYRFPPQGARTMVEFRDLWRSLGWSWEAYFQEAERHWETGFAEDPVLTGVWRVGLKTRDFALMEFSPYYCAFDVHLARLMARTGLLLHGYGDPYFDTQHYGFLRRLMQRLVQAEGWPATPAAVSPAVFDRTLWYFGQGFCGAGEPPCARCQLACLCLTGRARQP